MSASQKGEWGGGEEVSIEEGFSGVQVQKGGGGVGAEPRFKESQ